MLLEFFCYSLFYREMNKNARFVQFFLRIRRNFHILFAVFQYYLVILQPKQGVMDRQQQSIDRLKVLIESKVSRVMRGPKDFDFLSEYIFECCHQSVSSTTLKRLWGYLPATSVPRISTLDILVGIVGFDSWAAFLAAQEKGDVVLPTEETAEAGKAEEVEHPYVYVHPWPFITRRRLVKLIAALLLALAALSWLAFCSVSS
jgi:hypothetical protein